MDSLSTQIPVSSQHPENHLKGLRIGIRDDKAATAKLSAGIAGVKEEFIVSLVFIPPCPGCLFSFGSYLSSACTNSQRSGTLSIV
ncbi:hypothetical protein WJM97_03410 [Okeanomitos corallinicola TIOX110]|uniref:Uncharacterized protein n=1 Tax=Okeanomitos corallinicola TIOX110 TaxID=3133117 RepID=A0ABZ2UTM2_9CYAN